MRTASTGLQFWRRASRSWSLAAIVIDDQLRPGRFVLALRQPRQQGCHVVAISRWHADRDTRSCTPRQKTLSIVRSCANSRGTTIGLHGTILSQACMAQLRLLTGRRAGTARSRARSTHQARSVARFGHNPYPAERARALPLAYGTGPRDPLTCAQPVMPGFMRWRCA